jgi:p-cumate 2,3-dioxygenase subunit beta
MSPPSRVATSSAVAPVTRAEIEEFLYAEATLLDEWKLEEWLELFTDDATYSVPSTDEPEGDPAQTLFLIADDVLRLRSRVQQLLGKTTWSENPRSRTRRMIANVRIRSCEDREIRVTSNFMVYRMRSERVSTYVGRYEYVLARHGESLRIRHRKAVLDLESLRDVGKVSFIL